MANLSSGRERLMRAVDWDPSPTPDAVSLIDSCYNDAVQQVALEMPFLFHESWIRFRTQPDVEPTLATDTITLVDDTDPAATNPWTFDTDLSQQTSGAVQWKNDRSWDGRWIDILHPTTKAVLHRTRIQSVSLRFDEFGTTSWARVTIEIPFDWDRHGKGPFLWRVYTPEYYLPDDVIEYRNARLLSESHPYPLQVLGQREAEELGLASEGHRASGYPRWAFRREHFQLPGPNTAPDPAKDVELAPWLGPEPWGKFSYVITWTWGKRDAEFQAPGMGYWAGDADEWLSQGPLSGNTVQEWSENRFREPLFESAPSPISKIVDVTPPVENQSGAGVVLTLPNIEYMLGYFAKGIKATLDAWERAHHGRSGWHVRIYRRRHSVANLTNYGLIGVTTPGSRVSQLHLLDLQDAYYLLAEMPINHTNEGRFIDDGSIIPDYRRRLRDVNGYQSMRLHPPPNAEYDVHMRAVRRPQRLVSPSDAPRIHAEAEDVIHYLALTYLYEHMKDPGGVVRAKAMYDEKVAFVNKRYGDLRPTGGKMQIQPVRATTHRRLRYRWWRRSSS